MKRGTAQVEVAVVAELRAYKYQGGAGAQRLRINLSMFWILLISIHTAALASRHLVL